MKLYWTLTKGHRLEAVTVALAEDREDALERINHRLALSGLPPFDERRDTICEVTAKPSCFLLVDGDY